MNYFLLFLAFLVPTGLAVFCLYRIGQLIYQVNVIKGVLQAELAEQGTKITTLARQKGVTFTEHKCEICGSLLDERVARTHDGHYRCSEHKLVSEQSK